MKTLLLFCLLVTGQLAAQVPDSLSWWKIDTTYFTGRFYKGQPIWQLDTFEILLPLPDTIKIRMLIDPGGTSRYPYQRNGWIVSGYPNADIFLWYDKKRTIDSKTIWQYKTYNWK